MNIEKFEKLTQAEAYAVVLSMVEKWIVFAIQEGKIPSNVIHDAILIHCAIKAKAKADFRKMPPTAKEEKGGTKTPTVEGRGYAMVSRVTRQFRTIYGNTAFTRTNYKSCNFGPGLVAIEYRKQFEDLFEAELQKLI